LKFNFPEVFPALYIVSTPIGCLTDVSLRALNVLKNGNIILSEDTRKTKHLLNLCEIDCKKKKILKYNDFDFNNGKKREFIVNEIKNGLVVVLVSDAGTPLIADPGFKLVEKIIEQKLPVISIPGPCALISALVVSGLPTDSFFFSGFIPKKQTDRENFFKKLKKINSTLIFYESPKRINKSLVVMSKVFGSHVNVVICKELTKKFEEIKRDKIINLIEEYSEIISLKGEHIILVENNFKENIDEDEIISELMKVSSGTSMKDRVNIVTKKLEISRKKVYQTALKIISKTNFNG